MTDDSNFVDHSVLKIAQVLEDVAQRLHADDNTTASETEEAP